MSEISLNQPSLMVGCVISLILVWEVIWLCPDEAGDSSDLYTVELIECVGLRKMSERLAEEKTRWTMAKAKSMLKSLLCYCTCNFYHAGCQGGTHVVNQTTVMVSGASDVFRENKKLDPEATKGGVGSDILQ